MNNKVVVVGSYGVGLTLTADRMPDAGETVIGRGFATGHGGKGSNQAIAAARLGARVSLCTAVGSDEFGAQARTLWIEEGVDAAMVRTLDGSTMVGVILVDAQGENRIAIAPGVLADFEPAHLNGLEAELADADVLLVGLEIPVATAHEALAAGRRAGVTTILNPAPAPSRALPVGLLDLVDHLTPNRTEAALLACLPVDTDPHGLIAAPCFAGVDTIVLTLGKEGALVRHGTEVSHVDAHVVDVVVDTTGAGDAFSGAYAVQLTAGATPLEAAQYAAHAAALSVTKAEVVPSLPYRHELSDTAR